MFNSINYIHFYIITVSLSLITGARWSLLKVEALHWNMHPQYPALLVSKNVYCIILPHLNIYKEASPSKSFAKVAYFPLRSVSLFLILLIIPVITAEHSSAVEKCVKHTACSH